MSQVPQPRPWSRISSMTRGRAPAPASAEEPEQVQQPRLALPHRGFRPFGLPHASGYASSNVGSVPSSPTTRPIGGTASVPSSPTPRPKSGYSSTTTSPVRPAPPVTTSSVPTSPVTHKVPSPIPKPSPTATKALSPTTKPAPPSPPFQTSPTRAAPPPTSTDAFTNALRDAVLINAQSSRALKPEVQTPPQSPKRKSESPPPSPLTLPPSQLKSKAEHEPEPKPKIVEQKTVLVQKTFDTRSNGGIDTGSNLARVFKPTVANHNNEEHYKSTEPKEKIHHHRKTIPSSDESGKRIITLAGENKGAFMEVIRSPRNHRVFEADAHFLTKNKDKQNGSSSDDEDSNKKKGKSQKGKSKLSPPINAFTNSNVQGVNNSILFHSSCSNHDPGVHLAVTRKPGNGGFFQVKEVNDNKYHT